MLCPEIQNDQILDAAADAQFPRTLLRPDPSVEPSVLQYTRSFFRGGSNNRKNVRPRTTISSFSRSSSRFH